MIDLLNLGSDEKSTLAGSEFQTLTIRSVNKLRRFWFSHCDFYCSDVAERWSTKLCTIFGRPLLGWYTICIFGVLAPNGILPGAKCTLRPSLAFCYTGSVTARH